MTMDITYCDSPIIGYPIMPIRNMGLSQKS